MSVTAEKIAKSNPAGQQVYDFLIGTTATGQTAKATDFAVPGFPFEVVKVEASALTVTATASVDVQIGSTSVLGSQITPVAGAATAGTLGTSVRGGATAVLSALYTSNGTGAMTNGHVRVTIRPQATADGPIVSVP